MDYELDLVEDDMPMIVTSKLWKGLRYSDEDVESSSSFVLLCPYEILEDGTIRRFTEFDDPR